MYPSNSNGNTIRSNSLTNPNSSPSFHFPSPYIHYEDDDVFLQHLHDILHQQQPLTDDSTNMIAEAKTAAAVDSNNSDVNKKRDEQIPRKRSSKKDRHSKINTAHGPRDRRMRLSLEVAREFFGLQDMLRFDKASKTVEWLMTKSKSAIKELTMASCSTVPANSASSTSECEVLSGITTDKAIIKPSKEKRIRKFRKTAFNPLARESREKARARARERTEKRKLIGESNPQICAEDLTRVRSWSPFEGHDESGNTHINPSFEVVLQAEVEEQPSSREPRQLLGGGREDDFIDPSLITGNWSPSTFFNYQHQSGISHEHQYTDFQVYGKAWEGYNN